MGGGWVGGLFTGREGSLCSGTVELARAWPFESACGIALWKFLLQLIGLGHCIVRTSIALAVACGLGIDGALAHGAACQPMGWEGSKRAGVI